MKIQMLNLNTLPIKKEFLIFQLAPSEREWPMAIGKQRGEDIIFYRNKTLGGMK
jgi:hypothetical protein